MKLNIENLPHCAEAGCKGIYCHNRTPNAKIAVSSTVIEKGASSQIELH
jgi:hypothetical protein